MSEILEPSAQPNDIAAQIEANDRELLERNDVRVSFRRPSYTGPLISSAPLIQELVDIGVWPDLDSRELRQAIERRAKAEGWQCWSVCYLRPNTYPPRRCLREREGELPGELPDGIILAMETASYRGEPPWRERDRILDETRRRNQNFERTSAAEADEAMQLAKEWGVLVLDGPSGLLAAKTLRQAGVRQMVMPPDDRLAIGIWADQDSWSVRRALERLQWNALSMRYLDEPGIPAEFKVRTVPGTPVPPFVLEAMLRAPACAGDDPWIRRARLLTQCQAESAGAPLIEAADSKPDAPTAEQAHALLAAAGVRQVRIGTIAHVAFLAGRDTPELRKAIEAVYGAGMPVEYLDAPHIATPPPQLGYVYTDLATDRFERERKSQGR